jgi:hypothetical protein
VSKDNDTNNKIFPFGGESAPQGTVDFSIDLVRDTEEYGRQLVVRPKAHHPQMESLIARKGGTNPVLSLATCGFHQLATMKEVPEDIAEEYDIPQWAFRSSGVVNISGEILTNWEKGKQAILTNDAVEALQQFVVLYAEAVWRIRNPMVMMLDHRAKDENEYEGVPWFTFVIAFSIAVEQEEWEKLYKLKVMELDWARKIRDIATLKSKIGAALVIEKSKRNH